MKLYWIKYQPKGTNGKFVLVMPLGVENGKLCCIDADSLNTNEKTFLRSKASDLDDLALADKIAVIKRMEPNIARHFKTIKIENFVVANEYSIEPP